MEFLKPSSKTGLLSSTQLYPRPLFTSHSFDHCSIQATLRGLCPLSLPFYILSEMRVVEKEEGEQKNLRILDQVGRKAITEDTAT